MEHSYKDSRHKYIPASSYPTAKEDLLLDLVEIFKATALTSSAVHAEEVEEQEEEGPAAHSQEEEDEPAVEEEDDEPVVVEEDDEPVVVVEEEVEQDSSPAIATPQKADSYHDILAEEAALLLSTPAPPAEVLDLHDLDDDADALLAEQQQDILENDDEGGFESGEDW